MAMVLYSVALAPLVEILCHACPDVMQPWYMDDSALMGKHNANAKCLALLKQSLDTSLFPEPKKSWHICSMEEEEAVRAVFANKGL